MKKLFKIILIALCMPMSMVWAQEKEEEDIFQMPLEKLIQLEFTVASSKGQNVFNSASTVTVIDHEMLHRYNFLNVAEMLRNVVGMDIYQTNNEDNIPTSRGILQNFYANKVLVMINNVPTYQPIYGNTNLDRIDVNDIERIEVLRGPASVLYGSNAYVGVVNIVLRKVNDDEVNARFGTGYPRFGTAGANVSMQKKDFSLFVSGNSNYEQRKPYEIMGKRQDLSYDDSVYYMREATKSYTFNAVAQYKSVSFLINNYDYQHNFLGVSPSFKTGGSKPMSDRGLLMSLKYDKNFSEKLHFTIDGSYDYFKRDFAANADASVALVLEAERYFGRTKLNYKLNDMFDFEVGLDAEQRVGINHVEMDMLKDTIRRVNMKDVENITEISAFAQMSMKYKIINVLGGLRYTYNSFAGNNISSRITAVAAINETNSVKLIFGQSFRAPTMLELYFNHTSVVGNKDLKPELNTSLELAYVVGSGNFYVQALGYYSIYENLIQRYTPLSGPPSLYQNLGSFDGYGFEFEAKYQNFKVIDGFLSYNYMAAADKKANGDSNADAEINYRHVPKHTLRAGVNKNIGNFFVSSNVYAVSKVMGNPKLMREIDPQFMMDIHCGFRQILSNSATLLHSLSLKNATGAEMLIPEYVRQTDNINAQATTGFGRRLIYTLQIDF